MKMARTRDVCVKQVPTSHFKQILLNAECTSVLAITSDYTTHAILLKKKLNFAEYFLSS
jgi:hypothetical protein